MPPPIPFSTRQPNASSPGSKALLYDAVGNPISSTGGALNVAVQNFPTTQPISGTVVVSNFPATQAENLTQLAGNAIAVNTGTASTGTQRVVLATDQPALTNALPISTIGDGAQTNNRYPNWKANRVAVGKITAGNASSGTLITGASGYFIDGFLISVDPQATRSTAASLLIQLVDSSFGNIFQTVVYFPATAFVPASPTFGPQIVCPPNFRWNNKTAASTLSLTLNASITVGDIYITVNYALTSVVN